MLLCFLTENILLFLLEQGPCLNLLAEMHFQTSTYYRPAAFQILKCSIYSGTDCLCITSVELTKLQDIDTYKSKIRIM